MTAEFDSVAQEWHLKGFAFFPWSDVAAIKFLHLVVGVHDFCYSEEDVLLHSAFNGQQETRHPHMNKRAYDTKKAFLD